MQQLCSAYRQQPVVCSSSSPSRPHNHARPQRHIVKHWGRPASKDTPLRSYLRSTLALRDHTVNGGMLALCPALSSCGQEEVAPNISLLNAIAPPDQVRATVLRNPALLAVPLQAWHDFFAAIGLEDSQFWQLCCNSPGLLLHGSVWQTGNVLMFLQALGWSELELSTIIIPHHAEILQMDVQGQLQPVVAHLQDRGLSAAEARAFLHQHPQVLYAPDYQAAIMQLLRKQRLLQLQCI